MTLNFRNIFAWNLKEDRQDFDVTWSKRWFNSLV